MFSFTQNRWCSQVSSISTFPKLYSSDYVSVFRGKSDYKKLSCKDMKKESWLVINNHLPMLYFRRSIFFVKLLNLSTTKMSWLTHTQTQKFINLPETKFLKEATINLSEKEVSSGIGISLEHFKSF